MDEEISKLRKVRWGRGDFKSAQHYINIYAAAWGEGAPEECGEFYSGAENKMYLRVLSFFSYICMVDILIFF
jgi:hypothetical protein